MKHTTTQQCFATIKNKEDLHKLIWNGLQDRLLSEKAKCKKIYLWLYYTSEKAMAPHSSTLAWKISWMEERGGLQSMGLQRVRHD